MRIGFPFVGDTVGGSHLSALPVIEALPGMGYEPVVIVHQDGPLRDLLDHRGIATVCPPDVKLVEGGVIPGQLARMGFCAPRLAKFIRRHDLSIVHTNDARMHFTWGPAARLGGAAFIWHQRSADDSRRLAIFSRLATRILTISQFCKGAFAEPMRGRAEVIYDPFPAERTMPDRCAARKALLDELGMPDDTSIVGCVGNLTQQKRPDFFVDIAARLPQNFDGELVCPMFGELRQPMLMKVENRIRETGAAGTCRLLGPRYPIEPVIAAMDVLVAPAKSEGLGRTLVEAMICGTPVVAADHAGHREAIVHGETGNLVDPDNPQAFADAVAGLLKNDAKASALVKRARLSAKCVFSEQTHLDALSSVYSELRA